MGLDLNVVRNKISIIERCIDRVDEEYENNPENLKNYTKQVAIILNIQRACEAAIYLSMHLCAKMKLGVPQDSSSSFGFLAKDGYIPLELAKTLKGMVGFRNVAIHDYQALNFDIFQSVIEKNLDDLLKFGELILKLRTDQK